jgi:hypothetical protein
LLDAVHDGTYRRLEQLTLWNLTAHLWPGVSLGLSTLQLQAMHSDTDILTRTLGRPRELTVTAVARGADSASIEATMGFDGAFARTSVSSLMPTAWGARGDYTATFTDGVLDAAPTMGFDGKPTGTVTAYTADGARELDLPAADQYTAMIAHVLAVPHGTTTNQITPASTLDALPTHPRHRPGRPTQPRPALTTPLPAPRAVRSGRSDVCSSASEPLVEQRGQQLRLFVGQCVAGTVEDRERCSWVLVEQVDSRGVSDCRVLPAGDDKRRPPVRRVLGQGEHPAFADSLHRSRVGQVRGRRHVALIAVKHRGRLQDEVTAELLIAEIVRGDHGAVLGDVAHAGQKGTHQREPGDLVRPPRGQPMAVVGAGRVADKQDGLRTDDLLDEAEQYVEDVVGAAQRVRRGRASHARQVGIDASKTAAGAQGRFEASLGLAVIDARAMQDQYRPTLTALDEVDRDIIYLALHVGTVLIGADNDSRHGWS